MQSDIHEIKSAAPAARGSVPALKSPISAVDSTSGMDTGKTVDSFECLRSGAKVSVKVLKSARAGECINLVDFAPVLELSNTTETTLIDGELVFKQKRALRSIDSFLLWSLYWSTS